VSEHRYGWPALRGDYVRSVIGSVVAAGGAVLTVANPYVFGVFAGSAGLFVLFGFRTAWRQRVTYTLSAAGLARRADLPFARDAVVRWDALGKLSLRFYSTKRDRSQGWMQMTLSGGGCRISLDSTIDDFDAIARVATTAAVRNGIALRSSTLANLEAIGINTARLGSTPSADDPPL
jgi:hypothetical protein